MSNAPDSPDRARLARDVADAVKRLSDAVGCYVGISIYPADQIFCEQRFAVHVGGVGRGPTGAGSDRDPVVALQRALEDREKKRVEAEVRAEVERAVAQRLAAREAA